MNSVASYVINFLGGPDAVLALLPPHLVERAKETCMFSLVTGNLLATVLSYVDRKDVYSVMQVCRSWSMIPYTHRRVFWSRMVGRLVPFDTFFAIPQQLPTRWDETLRQQVEWIFRPGWCKEHNGFYKRRTHDGFVLQYSKISSSYKVYSEKANTWFVRDDNKMLWRTAPNQSFAWDEACQGDDTGNVWLIDSSDGCVFVGTYLYDDKKKMIMAHGDGKWTFLDGTVLEGNGVAWKGQKRQPYKRIKTGEPF